MTTFTITTTYPTQGSDALVWGEPEARLEAALNLRGVEIVGTDYGTMLTTGDRDAWLEVNAPSVDMLNAVIALLPSTERTLWKIEESK